MTSVGVFMKKLDDNSGPLYTGVMITGMKESYTINEPIAFSVMVHGYGSGCGDTKAILTKENDSNYKSQVWGVGKQCASFANPASFGFNGLSANTTINQTGNYTIIASFDDSVTYHHIMAEEKFSVTAYNITGIYAGITPISTVLPHNYTVPLNNYFYYGPTHQSPKVELYDHLYDGMDEDSTLVSLNNHAYYQTTLNYTIDNLTKGVSAKFQNVTFAFPEGVMNTPGGSMIMLDVKLPDGSEEIYGQHKVNPDGSGVISGISIRSRYGLSNARNSTTVLGYHVLPQAGLTIFHDAIKLLVSK